VNVPAFPATRRSSPSRSAARTVTDLPLDVGEKDLTDLVVTFVDTPMASLTVTYADAAACASH
jgi:hypothetical protein